MLKAERVTGAFLPGLTLNTGNRHPYKMVGYLGYPDDSVIKVIRVIRGSLR